jgi:site-specific DNA recombinase
MEQAIILARVSTLRQEKEGLSLDELQLPTMREYAKQKQFEVVKEFRFNESADRKIRKKFDEVISFVKSHKEVKHIIGFRVDRITRNYRDSVLMDDLRLDYGKELHFVHDRLTLNRESVGRDIQDWDMKVFLAKQGLNRLREDGLNTYRRKTENGEISCEAPFGYRNYTRRDKKKWVKVYMNEAIIVKDIYSLYLTGAYSMLQVRDLIRDKYQIPIVKSKIEYILKNPMYSGFLQKKNSIVPHFYETIVSKQDFDKVQEILNGYNKKPYKYAGLNYTYRGMIQCADCGCTITPEKKKGKYIYYHCTGYKGKHGNAWVREEDLTEQFAQFFDSI